MMSPLFARISLLRAGSCRRHIQGGKYEKVGNSFDPHLYCCFGGRADHDGKQRAEK
jgi:hypothetical protein